MFVIPAIVIAIIYLLLKILVPTILIIALIALVCIYYRNRGEGDGGEPQIKQINVEDVKEKATSAWEKAKFIFNWFSSKNKKDDKEQELTDI